MSRIFSAILRALDGVVVAVGRAELLGARPGDRRPPVCSSSGGDRVLEPGPLLVGELLGAGAQQVLDAVERVALAAAVAEGLLLDPAAALIDRGGAEVRSTRGAVPAFRLVRFPGPPPEPDVRLSPHPALHEVVPMVMQVLARPTVSECCPGSGNG